MEGWNGSVGCFVSFCEMEMDMEMGCGNRNRIHGKPFFQVLWLRLLGLGSLESGSFSCFCLFFAVSCCWCSVEHDGDTTDVCVDMRIRVYVVMCLRHFVVFLAA